MRSNFLGIVLFVLYGFLILIWQAGKVEDRTAVVLFGLLTAAMLALTVFIGRRKTKEQINSPLSEFNNR